MKARKQPLAFYFGAEDRKLFGCFHEPSDIGVRRVAILVCQPVGHEYINSHRALRQLAVGLADAGFPVLRFDYYGCGDSSGEAEQGSITRWVEDVSTAASELRIRSGMSRVGVVGLRLGATLAALAGSRQEDFENLVLWEPVVDGRIYLTELTELQKEMLRFRPKPKRSKSSHAYVQILGFPLSRFFRAQLEELDLVKLADKPASRVLIMRRMQVDRESALEESLVQHRTRVERQTLPAPAIWLPTPDGSLLVPAQVLQSVVSWVSSASS